MHAVFPADAAPHRYGAAISPSGPPCASSLSPTRCALFPSKRSSSIEASFLPPHLVHLIPDTQLPSPTSPAPVPIHARTLSASLTLMAALQGHPDAICSAVALHLSIDGREHHHTAHPSHCLCHVVHHPSPSRTQRPRSILLATLLGGGGGETNGGWSLGWRLERAWRVLY